VIGILQRRINLRFASAGRAGILTGQAGLTGNWFEGNGSGGIEFFILRVVIWSLISYVKHAGWTRNMCRIEKAERIHGA
jgi:hypothetical protein